MKFLQLFILYCICIVNITNAQSTQRVLLYQNDFENPKDITFGGSCNSPFVSQLNINALYQGTANPNSIYWNAVFNQRNTVEVLYRDAAETVYKDPSGNSGRYSLGMLRLASQNNASPPATALDRLSITFKLSDTRDLQYLNFAFDLSRAVPLNSPGYLCGVTHQTYAPSVKVKLYQHTASSFNAVSPPATYFASQDLVGVPSGTYVTTANNYSITYNWAKQIATFDISNVTQDYITITLELNNEGYIAIDNFYINADNFPLPITLKNFYIHNNKELKWSVEKAENFSHFELEASNDAIQWHYYASIAIEHEVGDYSYPASNDYKYYRLKMVNLDGTFDYSTIVTKRIEQNSEIKFASNPFQSEITITPNKKGTVAIYNMNGIKVYQEEVSEIKSYTIDTEHWSQGIYIINFSSDEGVSSYKLVK